MELKIIYEHEEMRDMIVHVNSDGMQKIMQILMDDNNIIVTQLTKRAADGLKDETIIKVIDQALMSTKERARLTRRR